jgi:hypothetical protein
MVSIRHSHTQSFAACFSSPVVYSFFFMSSQFSARNGLFGFCHPPPHPPQTPRKIHRSDLGQTVHLFSLHCLTAAAAGTPCAPLENPQVHRSFTYTESTGMVITYLSNIDCERARQQLDQIGVLLQPLQRERQIAVALFHHLLVQPAPLEDTSVRHHRHGRGVFLVELGVVDGVEGIEVAPPRLVHRAVWEALMDHVAVEEEAITRLLLAENRLAAGLDRQLDAPWVDVPLAPLFLCPALPVSSNMPSAPPDSGGRYCRYSALVP